MSSSVGTPVDRAEHYLVGQVDSGGRIQAKCAARPIETALYLHFLKDTQFTPGRVDSLRTLCATFASAPGPATTGTPVDLSEVFSRLIVRSVVGEQHAEARLSLRDALDAYAHFSVTRKEVLFSTVLADTGAIPFARLNYSPESFLAKGGQHHWATLVMTAAKLIYGAGAGDPRFTSTRDIEFIERSQSPNGSWENHILATLLILIALKRSGALPRSVADGVKFMESQLTPEGGVPFIPDLAIWLTGIAGHLFARRGTQLETRTRMAAFIAGAQHASGGWGFSEEVREADVDDTAICHLFLQRHDALGFQKTLLAAEHYILDGQNSDGGFPTYVRGAPSEVEATAHAVMALAANPQYRAELRQACDWLPEVQLADGSFPYDWTLSAHYGLSQVLLALKSAQVQTAGAEQLRARALSFTLETQNTDGGWGQFPGLQSTTLSTAYALIGLACQAGAPSLAARQAALDYLLASQSSDGKFTSAPDAMGPRSLVYDVDLFATVYPYWALSGV